MSTSRTGRQSRWPASVSTLPKVVQTAATTSPPLPGTTDDGIPPPENYQAVDAVIPATGPVERVVPWVVDWGGDAVENFGVVFTNSEDAEWYRIAQVKARRKSGPKGAVVTLAEYMRLRGMLLVSRWLRLEDGVEVQTVDRGKEKS